jgi:hypothetical protein
MVIFPLAQTLPHSSLLTPEQIFKDSIFQSFSSPKISGSLLVIWKNLDANLG